MPKINCVASEPAEDMTAKRKRPGTMAKEPGVKKTATMDISDMLRPGKLFGSFGLQRELDAGSTGATWLAEDYSVGRRAEEVTLKFLPDIIVSNPNVLRELKNELRRTIPLRHPNILRVYELVEDKGKIAVQMEYVDGQSLWHLQSGKPNQIFEVREVEQWVEELCKALEYAHREVGLVDGRLLPGNLTVDPSGKLKLKDFGIESRIADAMNRLRAKDHSSEILPFQSPQRAAGEEPAITDDVYALGAIICELLTGKPPLPADVESGVSQQTSMVKRRAEFGIAGEAINKNWDETVAACLARDPRQRPQSAIEVAKRLKKTLSPADAPAPSRSKNLLKPGKPQPPVPAASVRKPWLRTAGILLILAILSAVAFFSYRALTKPKVGEFARNANPPKTNTLPNEDLSPTPAISASPAASPGDATSMPATVVPPKSSQLQSAEASPTPAVGASATPVVEIRPTPSAEVSSTPVAETSATPPVEVSATPSAQVRHAPAAEAAGTPSPEITVTPSDAANTAPKESVNANEKPAVSPAPASQPNIGGTKEEVIKRINALPGVTAEKKANLIENMNKARSMERLMVIPFDSGRSTLRKAASDELVKAFDRPEIREKLSDPTIILVVAGYADAGGRPDQNLRISQTRAENVSRILKEQAKLLNAMQTIGMGGTELLDSKRPDQNRAVEIWVVVPL
jgi:serine/threonine protein kinase